MTGPVVSPVHVGQVRGRPLRLYPAPGPRPALPWVSAADWIAGLLASREDAVDALAQLPRGHLAPHLATVLTDAGPVLLVDQVGAFRLAAVVAVVDAPPDDALAELRRATVAGMTAQVRTMTPEAARCFTICAYEAAIATMRAEVDRCRPSRRARRARSSPARIR